jgi:hypothetical protein
MKNVALCALGLVCLAPQEGDWTQAELERETTTILGQLERLRGEQLVRPVAVNVASEEELVAYFKKRMEMTYTPERMAADETIGKLLGVVPTDMDVEAVMIKVLSSQVAGFYDPESDSFSLMAGVPRGIAPTILSHELVHALDDQLFDIDGTLEAFSETTDPSAAFWCVVEGSGQNVSLQWTRDHVDRIDLEGLTEFQAKAQAGMEGAPAWMWKPLLGSYVQGASFLVRKSSPLAGSMAAAESADIRAAFEHPPRSTEQVLHPEKYWDPEQQDEPRQVAFEVGELPKGWEVLHQDVLGEMMLAVVTSRDEVDMSNLTAVMGLEYTNPLAAGWGGDRVVLLGSEQGRVMRLVTVWDSARDAGEFYGGLLGYLPSMEAAAEALNPGGRLKDGAELEYGPDGEVVLTVWYGVERKDLKRLLPAIAWRAEDA